ncbi:hypothetical protein ACROYT_G015223 [Oculina patagonica]
MARYGAGLVVVKKQQAYPSSKNEERITAKLCHPNVPHPIGNVEQESRCDIDTSYYNVNGNPINLSEISDQDTAINWANILCRLCNRIKCKTQTCEVESNPEEENVNGSQEPLLSFWDHLEIGCSLSRIREETRLQVLEATEHMIANDTRQRFRVSDEHVL